MAAETENTLSKVDSLVEEAPVKKGHRRGSSLAADVYNIADLGECYAASHGVLINQLRGCGADSTAEKEGKTIEIAPETQKLNW